MQDFTCTQIYVTLFYGLKICFSKWSGLFTLTYINRWVTESHNYRKGGSDVLLPSLPTPLFSLVSGGSFTDVFKFTSISIKLFFQDHIMFIYIFLLIKIFFLVILFAIYMRLQNLFIFTSPSVWVWFINKVNLNPVINLLCHLYAILSFRECDILDLNLTRLITI